MSELSNSGNAAMFGSNEYAAVEIQLDYSDNQYSVVVWEAGDSAAIGYYPTWQECFDYVQTLPVAEEGGPTIAGIYGEPVHGDGPLPEVQYRFVGSEEAERLASQGKPGSILLLMKDLGERPLFEVKSATPKVM